MLRKEVQIERPGRWDIPFDEGVSSSVVDRMLEIPPFSRMDPDRFPESCSLRGILQNDTRVVHYRAGDVIIREGDYGNSAFMLLTGTVCVCLDPLPAEVLGRPVIRRWHTIKRVLNCFWRSRFTEVRDMANQWASAVGRRQSGRDTRIFLQDVPGVLNRHRTLAIRPGEIFGEIAALTRSQRTASVLAVQPSRLLEIRWQGLRDLMKYDAALRNHIDDLYRQNSLATHLRQTPWLQHLDKAQLKRLMSATQFETFGNFEWNRPFRELQGTPASDRIAAEPLIAQQGNAPNGLVLIRNGFARRSETYGHGDRTVSYQGKGQAFGLEELYHQWRTGVAVPLRHSLRAVGYVDTLRIPTDLIESLVFPKLSKSQRRELESVTSSWNATGDHLSAESAPASQPHPATDDEHRRLPTGPALSTPMLEFLVDQRLLNGSQAMVMQLDRCTRCDDCVRACSDTHDNNPRFVRDGQIFDRLMFASACMHCVDPVCMIGCPTGAIGRNAMTGAVTIHDLTCIGCTSCANSCPYQAIRMVPIRDGKGQLIVDQECQQPVLKATKCDLCADLIGGPACQRACPHDALVRIDLSRPDPLAAWLQR